MKKKLAPHILQQCKELLSKDNMPALIATLEQHQLNKHENGFILLKADWIRFEKDSLNNLIDREDKRLPNLRARFLNFVELLQSDMSLRPSFDIPPLNDTIPLENGVLMGRATELQAIHTALQKNKAFVLAEGFGGIGKSTTLIAYINTPEYQQSYSHIIWIRVWEGENSIEQSLIAHFRERLGLKEGDLASLFQQVLAHLKKYDKDTLLVLDNANNAEDLRKLKTTLQATALKVLASSRCHLASFATVPIKPLSKEEAKKVFLAYLVANSDLVAQYENSDLLLQILENIGYHTLVMEIIAKTLLDNPYVELQEIAALTQTANFDDEVFKESVYDVSHLMYSETDKYELQAAYYLAQIFSLANLNAEELQILLYFSILPAQPYPFKVPNLNFEELHENPICLPNLFNVEDTKEDKKRLSNILKSLTEKGFLQQEGAHTYYCHAVLHYAIHQHTKPTFENCEVVAYGIIKIVYSDSYTNQLLLADRLPIVENVLAYIKEDTKLISDVYNNAASIYKNLGNYEKALTYHTENVRIKEKVLLNEDKDLATAYDNIANTYYFLGNYELALEYALKAIKIREKIFSDAHPSLATSYNNIASIYESLGNYELALEYALKAIKIREEILDKKHPDLATSYNNIASIYENLGNYELALEYALKAIKIREEILDKKHPDLATSYGNIAITYEKLGNYELALEYALKVIKIFEEILDKKHPDLATSYNNIAITYYYLKNWEMAVYYEKKALSIRLKVLPNGHPYIKAGVNTMATILSEAIKVEGREKYAEVQNWFKEAAKAYLEK